VDRKRAHALQSHRLVSSGAGALAVSTNTFRRRPSQPPAPGQNRTGSGPLARLRIGAGMVLKRQTKRHQNNTPICFAHFDKCNGIVLACWRSTLPTIRSPQKSDFFSPSCEPASCRLSLPLPQLRRVPPPRKLALSFHMSGCSTNHLGLGLRLGLGLGLWVRARVRVRARAS
jgi:hypothetical protein